MTVNLRNLSARSVSISNQPPPVLGEFTIENSYVDQPFAGFSLSRSGSTDDVASVDWTITQNAYDTNTSTGAYVPQGEPFSSPTVWDNANSGVIPNDQESNAIDFPALLALKTGSLASVYNATEGYFDTDSANVLLFFTYPVAVTVTSMTFDTETDGGDPPSFIFYSSLTADADYSIYNNFNGPNVTVDIQGSRRYYRYNFPGPTLIKSFLVTGSGGYPQGRPRLYYGNVTNFVAATSGTATFGVRNTSVNIDSTFASLPPSGTTSMAVTLSNPVGGTIGTPSSATGVFGP